MSAHSQITILQYNMHISKDKVMAPFFRDRTNDNYSVIAVQEPWINSHNPELITTHHSNTANYELFFPTGANPHTCFFINKEIPVQNWTIVQHSPDLISLCLEHKELEETKHLWIHNIYRHESDNNHYNTSALWETALQAPGEHITVGDFNAHHPLWGGDIEPDSAGEQVLQTIDRFGLSSLLETGTITWEKGQSKTTIDLVLATPGVVGRMITCQVHQQAQQDSDHLPIMTALQLNIPRTQQATRKNWALLNEKRFLEFLSQHLQQTPPELRSRQDVENILTHITEVLQQAIAETVPNINITKWSRPKTTSKKQRDSGKGRELRKPGRNTRLPGTAKAASSRLSYAKYTGTVWKKPLRTLLDSGNSQNGPRTEATTDRALHPLSRDQMAQLQKKRPNC